MIATGWNGESARTSRLGVVTLFVVAFTLWLLNHPYVGLWHDAQIYAGIAAHRLHPQDFANELFFSFGSQGDLTIFSFAYAPLIALLGLDAAARALVLAGAGLWIAAAMWLASNMGLRGWAARLVVLLFGLLTVNYGPNMQVFNFPEAFATSRTLAFPIGVAASAALAGHRRRTAYALALLSLLLHPLLGVWPLALVILCQLSIRMGVVVCALPVLATVIAGMLALDWPLIRLMEPAWLEYAGKHSPDAWFRNDGGTRIEAYLYILGTLCVAALLASATNRRIYVRMATLATAALAMAWLSAYFWPVEIVLQGQPWRAFWLASVIACVGLIDVVAAQWRQHQQYRQVFVLAGLIGVAIFAPLWWADVDTASVKSVNPWWGSDSKLNGFFAGGMWETGMLLSLVPLAATRSPALVRRIVPLLGLMIAVGALTWALPRWDRRSESLSAAERCLLNDNCPPHPFRAAMNSGDVVYWPGDEVKVWLLLRHPTYISGNQRAGGVFSKRKSTESARREAHVGKFIEAFDLGGLCSDPIMQWVVSGKIIPDATPVARDGRLGLYHCAPLRAVSP